MDSRAIGIFDSGLGGLTAARVLEKILPNEDIIYFGDSGRMPYGGKSKREITSMAVQDAKFLDSFGVKAMLIACGTITSNSITELRAAFKAPFFGVVDAACAAAVRKTRAKHIGVIATEASIRSGVYETGIAGIDRDITVTAKACPPFAGMVERGHFRPGDSIAEKTVREQLSVFKGIGIDTLLLGCTHYPLLSDIISSYLGNDVSLVSAGAEAAKELADFLAGNDMLADREIAGTRRYFTSGDLAVFGRSAELFLGHPISPEFHKV